jgi:hypothetical protein
LVDHIFSLPINCQKHHVKPHNNILVISDWYTKQARYFPCHNTLDAVGLAKTLTRKLMLLGAGVPLSVVSNCRL